MTNNVETFEPVKLNEYYLKLIVNGLKKEIRESLFKPIFDLLVSNNTLNINNDKRTLLSALHSGRIYYENGAFRSSKPFSNAVAFELEQLGAKYKYGAYYIPHNMLPVEIDNALAFIAAKEATKVTALNSLLIKLASNIDKSTFVKSFIENAVIKLFTKLQTDLLNTTKDNNVPIIDLGYLSKQADKISKDYIDNMDYWVKNWKSKEIAKMRKDVVELVKQGARTDTLTKYFEKRWGIATRKAEFLARNESGIASSVLKATHYQNLGCEYFMWLRSTSIEKRELHLEYAKSIDNQYGINGTNIFAFNDPPIIEQVEIKDRAGKKTAIPKPDGQKGLPQQTYNCNCNLVGIKDPKFYENRKKIENAQRNIFTKIAYKIKNCTQRNNYPWRYRRFREGQEV